jgi:hypothetical protein
VLNANLQDSIEMAVWPIDPKEAIVKVTYNGIEVYGCDQPGSTMAGWGSPGLDYRNMYDGRPLHSRLDAKISKGILDT